MFLFGHVSASGHAQRFLIPACSEFLPGAPKLLRPRMPNPITYAATLASSRPSCPSRSARSCGAIPRNHSSAVTRLGGLARSRVAILSASRVMLAPCFCGADASIDLPVFEGCTEKTNSRVARTPSSRSGSWAKLLMNSSRTVSGTRPGWMSTFSAGSSAIVRVLGPRTLTKYSSIRPYFSKP